MSTERKRRKWILDKPIKISAVVTSNRNVNMVLPIQFLKWVPNYRVKSSGMWRSLGWWTFADVSEEIAASTFTVAANQENSSFWNTRG
jgi:hypothetical protein